MAPTTTTSIKNIVTTTTWNCMQTLLLVIFSNFPTNRSTMGKKYVSICVNVRVAPLSTIQMHPLLWLLTEDIKAKMHKSTLIMHIVAIMHITNGIITIRFKDIMIPVTSLDIAWKQVKLALLKWPILCWLAYSSLYASSEAKALAIGSSASQPLWLRRIGYIRRTTVSPPSTIWDAVTASIRIALAYFLFSTELYWCELERPKLMSIAAYSSLASSMVSSRAALIM